MPLRANSVGPQTSSRPSSPRRAMTSFRTSARYLALGGVLGTTLLPDHAFAHKVQYVEDLEIQSIETWLHNAVSDGIEKGAKATAEKVLSSVGKTILGGFLDSYVPGLSAVLGLGGGEQSPQVILDEIRANAVQLADRIRELHAVVDTEQSASIEASYLAAEDLFGEFLSYQSVKSRIANIGLIDEAQSHLQFARSQVEVLTFSVPDSSRLHVINQLQTHVIMSMLVATIAAERARLTTLEEARSDAQFAGTAEDYVLSLSAGEKEALDGTIAAQIQASSRAALEGSSGVFYFYERLANEGVIRSEVESWFTPLTHPTRCWNERFDASFDVPEHNQNADNWDEDCCDVGWSEWPVHERCVGFGDIFWYYYVRSPEVSCYKRSHELYEEEDAAQCNRFFVRNPGSVILASYDGYQLYQHSTELGAVEDHVNDVYDAFVAKTYGPISIYLDSLWTALGRTGTRPRNGLDNDLDYTIEDVPGVPPSHIPYGMPKSLNFSRFPSWSSAVFTTIAR